MMFQDINVIIPIVNDAINEAEEGFLVVLTITDPGADEITSLRNHSLVRIVDNDRKWMIGIGKCPFSACFVTL